MAQDNNQGRIPGFNKRGEGGDDKSQKRGPKFNIYWIYGIVALLLVGYQLLNGVTPTATVITDLKLLLRQSPNHSDQRRDHGGN